VNPEILKIVFKTELPLSFDAGTFLVCEKKKMYLGAHVVTHARTLIV